MRKALTLLIAFGFAAAFPSAYGSSKGKPEAESVPVTVSAANYSQLTDADLYNSVMNPAEAPNLPAAPPSAQPLYYLALPGEVYPNDVNADAVYRELELALERRNYFNVVYQERAGHKPPHIDYLLRIHYGVRPWLTPSVRADRLTWGDDGLVANKNKEDMEYAPRRFDDRTGLGAEAEAQLSLLGLLVRTSGGGKGVAPDSMDQHAAANVLADDSDAAHPFCMVVVEAFKFDEVKARNKKARCVWATYVAVPNDYGAKFSSVLHTMMQTAVPYFGETTDGIKQFEVPPGRVLMGQPFTVPSESEAHRP
jgi:hypothetical protein